MKKIILILLELFFFQNTDAQEKKLMLNFGHSDKISCVEYSPNGKFIATGSNDCTIKLWDAQNLKLIKTFIGHSREINAIAFSADSKFIISGSGGGYSPANSTKLWDIETGKCLRTFTGHKSWVRDVKFSPDGKQILSASYDGTVNLYDIKKSKARKKFIGHNDDVKTIAFSPDGKSFISGSDDKTVKLWNIETSEIIMTFNANEEIKKLIFSTDGKYIVACDIQKNIFVWNAKTYEEILKKKITKTNSSIINPNTKTEIKTIIPYGNLVSNMIFCPNKKHFVTVEDDFTIKLWDTKTKHAIAETLPNENKCRIITKFTADGKNIVYSYFDNFIRILNIENSTQRTIKICDFCFIENIEFSPNGKYVAISFMRKNPPKSSSSYSYFAKIYDAKTFAEIKTINNDYYETQYLVFSNNSKILIHGNDKNIEVWDIPTMTKISTLKEKTNNISVNIAISPNNKYVVSSDYDNKIILWNSQTGKLIRTIFEKKASSNWVRTVAFSPDGKYIVAGSGYSKFSIWETESGKKIKTLKKHDWIINKIIFSKDGKYILSASDDKTMILWDAKKRKKIRQLIGHEDYVTSISFSSDNKRILSGSRDGTMKIWNTETGKLLLTIKKPMRNNEWIMYSPSGKYSSNNAKKYFHYIQNNKVILLPKNDSNYKANLLSELMKN